MNRSNKTEQTKTHALNHLARVQAQLGNVTVRPSQCLRKALNYKDKTLKHLESVLHPLDIADPLLCSPLADNLALVFGCSRSLREGLESRTLDIDAVFGSCSRERMVQASSSIGFASGLMGDMMQGLAGAVFVLSSLPSLPSSVEPPRKNLLIQWKEGDAPVLLQGLILKVETGIDLLKQGGLSSLSALLLDMCSLLVLLSTLRQRNAQTFTTNSTDSA